jgi:hypothetical protein
MAEGPADGLNQTIDFILYDKENKKILLIKNKNVTGTDDKVAFPGTFGSAGEKDKTVYTEKNKGCKNFVLGEDKAIERLKYLIEKKKLTTSSKDIGKLLEDNKDKIKDHRFFEVRYDVRLNIAEDDDANKIMITQVFSFPANDKIFPDTSTQQWADYDFVDIFRGHKLILNDLKNDLKEKIDVYDSPPAFEEEEDFDTPEFTGGSRKRRGKKLNKTKKWHKQGGRKHSGHKQGGRKHSGGKTRKHRHSKNRHSRRKRRDH